MADLVERVELIWELMDEYRNLPIVRINGRRIDQSDERGSEIRAEVLGLM